MEMNCRKRLSRESLGLGGHLGKVLARLYPGLGWAALQAQMWIAFIDLGWTVLSIRFLQGPSQARSWTLESETLENSGGIQL